MCAHIKISSLSKLIIEYKIIRQSTKLALTGNMISLSFHRKGLSKRMFVAFKENNSFSTCCYHFTCSYFVRLNIA